METDEDGRDLSFAAVTNLHPKTLTRAQLAHYNQEGYITPLELFSPAEADHWRAYFDHLLAELVRLKDGRDGNYAINGYHVCCEGLWELATHPRLLDYVEDIVGPDFVAWGSHFFCKQPHDPKHVPWHQDASYWPFTPARTVTVWLAIDDTDDQNSAMRFLPRTHSVGHLAWKKTEKDAVLWQEVESPERFGAPVTNSLKAGHFSLHADMLVHAPSPTPQIVAAVA